MQCLLIIYDWIMAAADYYNPPLKVCTKEEHLEIQARDIDQRTLLLQARLRGYLIRHQGFRSHKENIAITNNVHSASYRDRRYGIKPVTCSHYL